jgi:hypothetical protein
LHGGYAMDAPLINTDVKNSPVWVAGYPGYPFDGGMQCVKWNKINDRIVNVYSNQHTIDDIGAFSTINSYDLELTSAANLHGGSSGSMIITTTNDDWKYKVVGIYWGGYYNSSSGTWLRGMGTALKTSSYNLLTF